MTERERQRQKERVLTIFETHREAPGTPLDESHFLDFILAAPDRKRAVYDSVPGMKRLDAFFDQIQLEYSICFTRAERGANYSLDAMVTRIMALLESPRSSIIAFQEQEHAVYAWKIAGLADIVILLGILALVGHPVAMAVVAAFGLVLNVAWLWSRRQYGDYRARLFRQLRDAEAARRKQATGKQYESML
jgi:hypothetical protein